MISRYRAMPRCIGQYELGHVVCDGGPGKIACTHRDICVNLLKHTKKKKTKPSDYIILKKDANGAVYAKPLGEERFSAIIEKISKEIEPSSIIMNNPKLQKKRKPVKDSKKRKSPWDGNYQILNEWFEEWLKMIAKGVSLRVARLAVEARPGELYFRDQRRAARSEATLYIRGKPWHKDHGKDFPIAQLRWQTRKLRMSVAYAFPITMFDGISVKRLSWIKPRTIDSAPRLSHVKKRFPSESFGLTRPQLRMSAEILIDLIIREKFNIKPFLESLK